MDKQDQTAPQQEEQPIGRISNTGNEQPTTESADISKVDQQEGEMDHGETGGK